MAAFVGEEDQAGLSVDAVRAIFDEFDTDKSGSIDAAEFQVVTYALGEVLTEAEVNAAISELDSDKNGTIDFNEFFNWINKPRASEQSGSQVELAILKAKLAGRYYRKIATNGAERLRARIVGIAPQQGDTSINVDVNVGSPKEAIVINFSQKEGDGNVSAAVFFTLKAEAQEAHVGTLITVISDALAMAPLDQLPGYVSHTVEVVDYRGGRAIRIQVNNALNPLQMVQGQFGFDPSSIRLNAVRVTLGASLQGLLTGESTLRELLKLRVQLNVLAPNAAKTILKELAMMSVAGSSQAPAMAAGLAFYGSLKELNFALEFDDFMAAANELMSEIGEDAAGKSQFLNRILDTNVSGLRAVLNSAVKMGYEMMVPMSEGLPPFVGTALAEYDAFTALQGVGGVLLNFGSQAYELQLTGLDILSLLPSAEERDAAKPLPTNPMEAPAILDGPLLEIMYDEQNPMRIPRAE